MCANPVKPLDSLKTLLHTHLVWCSCLQFAIIFHSNDEYTFADLPSCDYPDGVCVYYKDPCPPDIPYECKTDYDCPLATNKCCCRESKHGVDRRES